MNIGQIPWIITAGFSTVTCRGHVIYCIISSEFFLNCALDPHTLRRGILRWLTHIRSLHFYLGWTEKYSKIRAEAYHSPPSGKNTWVEKLKPQTLNIVILKASNCMILYPSSIIKAIMLYRVQICIVHPTLCWDEQWFTWLIVQKTQSNPPSPQPTNASKILAWHLLSWCLKRMERCLLPGRGNSDTTKDRFPEASVALLLLLLLAYILLKGKFGTLLLLLQNIGQENFAYYESCILHHSC